MLTLFNLAIFIKDSLTIFKLRKVSGGAVTSFQSDVYNLNDGSGGSPSISASYNTSTGLLTVTATRGGGSANLRDLYLSIESVNANGKYQSIV